MTNTKPGFPWGELMKLAIGDLRMRPDAFWKLTLPELRALIGSVSRRHQMPVSRDWLIATMNQFPDNKARDKRVSHG